MNRYIRGLMVVFLLVGVYVYFWYGYKKNADFSDEYQYLGTMGEEGVPDFPSTFLDGSPFLLSHFKEKVILLNFWASWCPSCKSEFSKMIDLAEKFKGKVFFLAVSNDKNRSDVEEFIDSLGERGKSDYLKVLWDPELKVSSLYKVNGLPETFILDKNHKLVKKVVGAIEWGAEDVVEFLEKLSIQE